MNISKINGVVTIVNGKLDLTTLIDDGAEIKLEIDKLLAMKKIMDITLFNYEKDWQAKNKDTSPYKIPKDV